MKNIVYLHTGSNQNGRLNYIQSALEAIEKKIGTVLKTSSVYETKAWGENDQPDFLNQVLQVETNQTPFEVLEKTKTIERDNGRKRLNRWGARTLDIDLLLYGNEIIETKMLTIPHPLLHKRNFVLVPLAEIAGHLIHPELKLSINQLLDQTTDKLDVKKYQILNSKF